MGRGAGDSGDPSEQAEGKQWWLQLQRQRRQAGMGQLAGSESLTPWAQQVSPFPPATIASTPGTCQLELHESSGHLSTQQEQRRRHRALLLQASQALLRRASSTQQQQEQRLGWPPTEPSSSGLRAGAIASSSANAAMPQGNMCSAGRPTLQPGHNLNMHLSCSLSRSLTRTRSSRGSGGSLSGSSNACADERYVQELLQGGLIGRSMQASAAWKAMQAQLAERERAEWQVLQEQCSGSSRSSGRTSGGSVGRQRRYQDTGGGSVGGGGGGEGVHEGAAAVLAPNVAPGPARLQPLEEGCEGGKAAEEEEAATDGGYAGQAVGWRDDDGGDGAAAQEEEAALLACFGDPEIRRYLKQQLDALDSDSNRSNTIAAAAAPSSLSMQNVSAEATSGGGDAGAGLGPAGWDPMLTAWMVTRAPPDAPVRGYRPPPGRTACRLIAAKEMQEYYKKQQQQTGCYFRWLGLTQVQAGGRPSDTATMQLHPEPAAAPKRKTLRGAVHKSLMMSAVQGVAVQSKAAVWAREHALEVTVAAEEQLKAVREREAAAAAAQAEAAARAAAAAALRRRLGDKAGAGFAAVVQQACQQQQCTSGRDSSMAAKRGGSVLPALQLQKLTQRWQRAAAASVAAAGQQTARQRREAAARQQLRDQWAAVQQRLPSGTAGSQSLA